MNILCDEGVEGPIVERLRQEGHDVIYIAELDPGVKDDNVLEWAVERSAPLVTTDKDFGELVFRQGRATSGVILLRLAGLSNESKATLVAAALQKHVDEIPGSFTVISPGRVRVRRGLPSE